ncbi:MAG: YifB family Mg chelatase-like AAA ATPase [Gammaproteobacteria bacterium]|nr:YifB family Mg chelatase-like AAA ATPase [Gammaproteobacteria bacterium]
MSLAVIHSRAQVGVDAPAVTVEVHLANGLPGLSVVGLPELAVREAKDRVRSALQTLGFEFPARRITINLAPADLPKDGGRFDLPMALGILAANGQLPREPLADFEFIGELALGGDIRPVRGVLSAALAAHDAGRRLVVPAANGEEASLASRSRVLCAGNLLAVTGHFLQDQPLPEACATRADHPAETLPDLRDIRGQHQAKRALEVAASAGHSLLMMGPPGSGKTMLAQRLPSILPPMTEAEALESAAIHSISDGGFDARRWGQRPFRRPHHTASAVALVGGGSHPRPGEISLAHHGVLFLDELPEFQRAVLEVLREPLESGEVMISRAARQARFPARFQLVAAMNPCPCGYEGDISGRCRCTPDQIQRYRQKLSGPLMDRIDLHVIVPAVPTDMLMNAKPDGQYSAEVRERILRCRDRQLGRQGKLNSALGNKELDECCELDADADALIRRAIQALGLSARGYHRILRVARTLADLAGESRVSSRHLAEAIQFRQLDRKPARAMATSI